MSVPKKDFKKLVRLNYNPYVIFKIIGQGQYGLVYLAHSRGEKKMGLKFPRNSLLKNIFIRALSIRKGIIFVRNTGREK